MTRIIVAAVVALVIGLVIGFFAGRAMLEASWSQPYAAVTPAQYERSANAKADPTPAASTKILKPMPMGRARLALKTMTANDPVVVTVVSEGAGDKGIELHVVVENHTGCNVKALSGVAYGFDAHGQPAKMNWAGEPYVAFKGDLAKQSLEPGKHATVDQHLAYVDVATLGVGHVDSFTCTDGTSWKRQ